MQSISSRIFFKFILGWLCVLTSLANAAAAETDDYRVGPGDLLKINAFGYPDLATDVRVTQSGNITFPLLGELEVSGLSTRDAEKLLAKRLADGGFIRQAQVSILVTEYQSQKISVMGQVAKPGQYSLSRSNKVLDLLAEAGGVINTAAGEEATLLRRDGVKIPIDLGALFEGDPQQNPIVAAGDTLYVPKAPQFYIYGEVQRPGVYRLERGMTVSRALSAGGGLTARGSEGRTIVKRRVAHGNEPGKEKKISVAGSDLLQPDDVLLVRESLF
jgi:polysaccharide export outer membrane protein